MELQDFLHSELLCVIPVLWFAGRVLKGSEKIKSQLIPFILSALSVVLCGIYLFAVSDINGARSILLCAFMSVTQGLIAAACAVFGNQLIKQGGKLIGKCNDNDTENKDNQV